MSDLLAIIIGAALVNNIVLIQLLGVSSLFRGSSHLGNAATLGLFSSVVLLGTALIHYPLNHWILDPLGLQYLELLLLVAISAALANLLLRKVRQVFPGSFRRQHVSLMLMSGNSAVVGNALLLERITPGFLPAMASSVGAALGFVGVLVLFAALRERLETATVPPVFRGLAIDLVSAGLAAMALLGVAGAV